MAQLNITQLSHPSRKDDPLWVVNDIPAPNTGPLMLNTTDGDGTHITVTVPNTFIPVDLCEQASREFILKSQDFRRACAARYLRALDEEEAMEILGSDAGRKEDARIRGGNEDREAEIAKRFGEDGNQSGVNDQIQILMEVGGDEAALLNKLRLMDDVKDDDWRYVAQRAKESGMHGVAAFANGRLESD